MPSLNLYNPSVNLKHRKKRYVNSIRSSTTAHRIHSLSAGTGFRLLALAKGMSTLFAKNGFSRPSLQCTCGDYRHGLYPQDKECTGSIYIARRKLVCIFEESVIFRSRQLK